MVTYEAYSFFFVCVVGSIELTKNSLEIRHQAVSLRHSWSGRHPLTLINPSIHTNWLPRHFFLLSKSDWRADLATGIFTLFHKCTAGTVHITIGSTLFLFL